MTKIKIKMMGIFCDFLGNEIELICPNRITVSEVKVMIRKIVIEKNLLFLEAVLNNSILSNNKFIFNDSDILKDEKIYLLPPFSGGN